MCKVKSILFDLNFFTTTVSFMNNSVQKSLHNIPKHIPILMYLTIFINTDNIYKILPSKYSFSVINIFFEQALCSVVHVKQSTNAKLQQSRRLGEEYCIFRKFD